MYQYRDMLRHVRENGIVKKDRTGTGTMECFGIQTRFDLSEGFPIDSLKKVFFRGALVEWIWMLSGETNIRPLLEKGISIWTDWPLKAYNAQATEKLDKKAFEKRILEDRSFGLLHGDLGPVYGAQWRNWKGEDGKSYDQVLDIQNLLKNNPDSRRIILNGWNVADIDKMALPPCHTLYQFNVTDGRLSLMLYQRSGDMFLGVPFNQVAGGLWIHALAQAAGLLPGEFVHVIGSAHIYLNHLDQVDEVLKREPRPFPKLELDPAPRDILDFREEHFRLVGYNPHDHVSAPVAV